MALNSSISAVKHPIIDCMMVLQLSVVNSGKLTGINRQYSVKPHLRYYSVSSLSRTDAGPVVVVVGMHGHSQCLSLAL